VDVGSDDVGDIADYDFERKSVVIFTELYFSKPEGCCVDSWYLLVAR
jgi:hypothetical protein